MREPTLFARSSWTMIVITSPAYVDDGAPFTALYSRAPIDVVNLFVNGGQHAFLLRRRSELLLFDVAFTGSSECAIHPVAQHASPDALSKAARQHLLPFSHTLTCACVQVMRVDAGEAVHSFYLELGGDLGLPQHLLAALGIGLRQGCGRGGRGGKRRRPDGDPAACRGRPCGASGVLIQIKLYMYVRIVSPCAPPT